MEISGLENLDNAKQAHIKTCRIIHRQSENSKCSINIEDGDVIVRVFGTMDKEKYLTITGLLTEIGIERIELDSYARWLRDGCPPERVKIADHIACHSPNILTGSESARKGEAFIDMRNAYPRAGGDEDNILWHTMNLSSISKDELEVARKASCIAASDSVVPWVVGTKLAGIKISVWVALY